ncbi:cytochrome P450 [Sphingomonas histidinilytica]|jgi:cytochrome P450|uniref:Cytochrome P450 n=1 Tax=Rhizorhabdus histidinilytica TaxID=439228 RepID=A0A1T5GT74_9SPHN|nr:cytochrome P450 [Rhizorhabdus histidinilytica]MBO9378913.1 cytochrome P450 [Rhizorhabdus histidinilytica]QEH77854.1 cytochrome P450 [Sphingomonas sp. C8-2]SKC11596.1 Cytochrome P450 [Rhizorhabdus histidinilytica]
MDEGSSVKREISFNDPDIQRCPFAAYREIREQGPVYYDKSNGFYIVTGYEDIRKAASDPKTFSSVTGQLLVKTAPYQERIDAIYREKGYMPVTALVVADPPIHSFHRSLVDKVFTLSTVKRMEEYLAGVVDEMVDQIIDRGQAEFYYDLAVKIPNHVLSDQIGLPRERYADFKRWADAIVQESDPSNDEERQVEITNTICELQQFLVERIEEYRRTPRPCILNDLVHADVDGQRLSIEEIIQIVEQMLPAGSDTTVGAIASALHRIATTPGLEDELRSDPSLIANFVEEVLRIDAPVQGLWRRATRDTEIGGVPIPEGSIIVLRFGAGNHDPEVFTDPGTFDIRRSNARRHFAFGVGPHYCVGNLLARGEMRITIGRLLERMRNLRLARGEAGVEWQAHFFAYGPNRLEIAFDRT